MVNLLLSVLLIWTGSMLGSSWDVMESVWEDQRRMMAALERDLASFNHEVRKSESDVFVKASEIKLPEIKIEKLDKEVKIVISQLHAKKEDISIEHHDRGVITVTFPSGSDRVTMTIDGRIVHVVAEQEIRKEKKNEKGEVVSQAAFSAHSAQSMTLPKGVDISKIAAEYKNGILMLTLPQKEHKRTIEIK